MKYNKLILTALSASLFLSCAEFAENYENVIAEKKIRPFGIKITPAEAMPGDTVEAELLLWDAGKDYQVQWHMGLGYSIANYGTGESVKTMLDLDSMATDVEPGSLKIRFVIPHGDQNPLKLSPMVSVDAATIDALDTMASIPNEETDQVDALLAPLYIDAVVTSGDFKLKVQKLLTIRYSKKLEQGEILSSVNENPHIDSLALIIVDEEDVEDPEKIAKYESDTLWFSTQTRTAFAALPVESIPLSTKKSYFWMASSAEPQNYRSPAGLEHPELLNYQWFYTNLDDVGDDWGDQIEFTFHSGNSGLNIACMQLPANKDMKEFAIHVALRDNRPEWQMLNSAGFDFVQFRGRFE